MLLIISKLHFLTLEASYLPLLYYAFFTASSLGPRTCSFLCISFSVRTSKSITVLSCFLYFPHNLVFIMYFPNLILLCPFLCPFTVFFTVTHINNISMQSNHRALHKNAASPYYYYYYVISSFWLP